MDCGNHKLTILGHFVYTPISKMWILKPLLLLFKVCFNKLDKECLSVCL